MPRRIGPGLGGEAWDRYLAEFAEFYPTYRDYIARAGRDVPIWVLGSDAA